jgi:hypothetical protein
MAKPVSMPQPGADVASRALDIAAADPAVNDAKSPVSAAMQSDSTAGEAIIASAAGQLF